MKHGRQFASPQPGGRNEISPELVEDTPNSSPNYRRANTLRISARRATDAKSNVRQTRIYPKKHETRHRMPRSEPLLMERHQPP